MQHPWLEHLALADEFSNMDWRCYLYNLFISYPSKFVSTIIRNIVFQSIKGQKLYIFWIIKFEGLLFIFSKKTQVFKYRNITHNYKATHGKHYVTFFYLISRYCKRGKTSIWKSWFSIFEISSNFYENGKLRDPCQDALIDWSKIDWIKVYFIKSVFP